MEQRAPSPAEAPQQTNPQPSWLPLPDTPAGLPSWVLDVTSLRSASVPARQGKDPDCPNSTQMPSGAARPVPGLSRCPVSCLVSSPPLSLLTHTFNRPILTSPLGFQARLRLWGLLRSGRLPAPAESANPSVRGHRVSCAQMWRWVRVWSSQLLSSPPAVCWGSSW